MVRLKRVEIDSFTCTLIDALKEHTKTTKTNEVVLNSISMLIWAVKQVRSGKKIASVDVRGNVETFTMPILERVNHE